MKFYNRVNELSIIRENEKQSYDSAVFMVLTGRRRVGKTSLVTKAMEGKEYAYLFVSKSSESLLCRNFQQELQQHIRLRNARRNVVQHRQRARNPRIRTQPLPHTPHLRRMEPTQAHVAPPRKITPTPLPHTNHPQDCKLVQKMLVM